MRTLIELIETTEKQKQKEQYEQTRAHAENQFTHTFTVISSPFHVGLHQMNIEYCNVHK